MKIRIVELGTGNDTGRCWPCGAVARYFVELLDKGFNVCYACKCALQVALDKPEQP